MERLWFNALGMQPELILETLIKDTERVRRAVKQGLPQRQVH
ncbi:MAG: hypothetical protein A4E53_03857 [Pelotomaculum sp. PtaB.Bin104]|nr:MAG: hypothetical protein A4E53_03857 [Pelotomaculum sp. PtaB.Bin104]